MYINYQAQVELLLTCLPTVASIDCFALKGGTALNFFDRQDFPRLSIDIDLVYLPIEERTITLVNIEKGLFEIKKKLKQSFPALDIIEHKNSTTKTITKLTIVRAQVAIKIEPNLILRGIVYPIRKLDVSKAVITEYGMAIFNVPVVSAPDLYAGKILAALDRQHPRDLFDVAYILEQKFTHELKLAFLVYLISHNRPMHELLDPNLLNQKDAYDNEFVGMTKNLITYEELIETREKLIFIIKNMLTKEDKDFLLSVKKGIPNWKHLALPDIEKLPGVMWKLLNINKMDAEKRQQAIANLEQVLYG